MQLLRLSAHNGQGLFLDDFLRQAVNIPAHKLSILLARRLNEANLDFFRGLLLFFASRRPVTC